MAKSKKILFAGYEIGGQMQLLAETMRKRGFGATSVAFNNDARGYQNDINMSYNISSSTFKRFIFFLFALSHYDVFHFFWGVSLFAYKRFHLLDLPILKLFKKRIIVHFRGGDVLDGDSVYNYNNHKNKFCYSESIANNSGAFMRKDQKSKLLKWKKYSSCILVSTPDLKFVSDNCILSPQVIDMNYWRRSMNCQSEVDGIIRIVHAPSNRRKKGTDFIEETILKLQEEGYLVELVLAENLPHNKIKELYEISDIGIDQILYGWHGKVSVELMALGKPVVCNINPEYKKYRPDLPIVHGDPENLYDVLKELIHNKELRIKIGKESEGYVAKYHDVEKEVDRLFDLYGMSDASLKVDKVTDAKTW
jgi:glycosyltransferase involved in cell wall biosynthesis